MTHPVIIIRRHARYAASQRGLPPAVCDDLAQSAALDALERYDATRSRASSFGWQSVAWQMANLGRFYATRGKYEPAIAYEAAHVETPEEIAIQREREALARELAEAFDPREVAFVVSERPLRERAERAGVSVTTVWRARESLRARMRDAAREVGL